MDPNRVIDDDDTADTLAPGRDDSYDSERSGLSQRGVPKPDRLGARGRRL